MVISNHTFSNLILRPNGVNPQTVGADGLPGRGRAGRGGPEGAGRQDGRAERLRQHPRLAALRHHRHDRGLHLQRDRRLRVHLRDRSQRVPPAVPAGRRRVPRHGQVRRQGQPRGLPDRAGARVGQALLRSAQGQGPEARDAPAQQDVQVADLGRLVRRRDPVDRSSSARTGRFSWLVNPSTRPAVQSRTYQVLSPTPFASKTIDGITPPVQLVDRPRVRGAPSRPR